MRIKGEVLHFSGLDEGGHLEKLVGGAEPAGHDQKGVGILGQHQFADEKITELHPFIQVGVRGLFGGKLDIAPDGFAPRLLRARLAASIKPGPLPS